MVDCPGTDIGSIPNVATCLGDLSDGKPDTFNCRAKDLDYLSCRVRPDPPACVSCKCGENVQVVIECIVENGTGSDRGVAYVAGSIAFSEGSCPIEPESCK